MSDWLFLTTLARCPGTISLNTRTYVPQSGDRLT